MEAPEEEHKSQEQGEATSPRGQDYGNLQMGEYILNLVLSIAIFSF